VTSHLAGTWVMLRLVLRRDRVRLPLWLGAILGIVYSSAAAVSSTYTTPEQIAAYAAAVGTNPAAIAMGGPAVGLDRIGGILVYETSLTALVGAALMSVFLVVRHTRGDEEEGRTELLRSTVLGRYAHSAATLVVLVAANLVLGAGVAASLLSVDVPAEGAVIYGAAVTTFGTVFAAVATLAAQLMSHARAAVGLSLSVLGAAFVLRALGDTGNGVLSWFSPMGWSQQVLAFDENRWWPLAPSWVLVLVLLVASVMLLDRRDLGAGVVAQRPGRADARRGLRGPVSLALRLQRGSVLGWSVGAFIGGATFGSMSDALADLVESNPVFAEYFAAAGGGSLVDSFFATALLIMSLLGAAFAVASVLRARGEEVSGRLEPMLATGLSRDRWLLGSLCVTLLGTVVVIASAGLGLGLTHQAVSDEGGAVVSMLGYALAYVPAALVLGGIAVLLLGAAPRATSLAWVAMAFCFVVGWLGGLLQPPQWVFDASPFSHTPAAPAEAVTAAPLLALTGVAVACVVGGLVGFRRRDVG